MSKILRVNMSTLSLVTEEPKEEYHLLGGRAFIAKYMLAEVKSTCEPLGRHNRLIFTPGLLGGSNVFSSGRISIGGKSPLTGGIKESNGGGVVGIKLARLGYQAVIIEDLPKGAQKYILKITVSGAELLPDNSYWGCGVYETTARLRQDFGEKFAVSCIGPAGENRLLAAGIANTDADGVPSRYSGRGGLGAVMGSKGLKALVLDDTGAGYHEPKRPEAFKRVIQEYAQLLKTSPLIQTYADFGTAALVNVTNALGGLPTRNFSTGQFSGVDKISGETLRETILTRKGKPSHACMPGCLIKCSNVYVDEQGKDVVAPLEYETIALMGSNLEIEDLDVIARLNYLCNDYGLDTIETGAALGVAMAGGLLSFGDHEGAISLVEEVGKATLTGRVIGNGAKLAGKILGVLEVPVVKGQAMAAYEPRAIKGIGVTYATSPMGADHTAGNTIRASLKHNAPEGQAAFSQKAQYAVPVYDALGLCVFSMGVLGAHPEILCRLVSAQLGMDYVFEDLQALGMNTIQWERAFNQAAGFTNVNDRLPEHFTEIPNSAAENAVFDVSEEELDNIHQMSI
ncbi:aldehyde ferredoxin oxidoreductase C-terminal domain-containing protein [Desulfosporosinus burensis]